MHKKTPMYISKITSGLHSQWHKNFATKKIASANSTTMFIDGIVSLTFIKHFSSGCRTLNKDNTEYRTSVQIITLFHPNKENSEKKQNSKQFFTVTVVDRHNIHVY